MAGESGLAELLWGWVTAASGSLALSFIVALAFGIAAMTILFLTSAVVVLDRFARTPRKPLVVLGVGVVFAGIAAWEALHWSPGAQNVSASERLTVILVSALATGGMMTFMAVVLSTLRPATVAGVGLLLLASGYAIVVAGIAHGPAALAPLLVVTLAAFWFRRRKQRGDVRLAEPERWAWTLAAVLTLGFLAALVMPRAYFELAGVGVLIMSGCFALILLGLLPLAVAGFISMRSSVEWFVGVRYLVAKRRQTFISVISLICMGGVAVGVWLIITVLSVMNGFERIWRDEVIGNRAHLTVHSHTGPFTGYGQIYDQILTVPDVLAASPYLDAEGMVRGNAGEIVGIRLRGIDPERLGAITSLAEDLEQGSLSDFSPRALDENGGRPVPGIVIGHRLARGLGFGVGDPVLVVSPFGGPETPLGPAPRLKRFRVAGIFKSSSFQLDEVFTYVDLPAVQDFRRTDDVAEGILVRVQDFYRSVNVGTAAARMLGFPFYAVDWKQAAPSFFQALKTERVMMFILLTMIIVVAAFMIVATLIMMIMEKSSDIAILKAMGATDEAIERIFAIEGTMIGLVGTALGVIAGVVVTTQLDWIQRWVEALFDIDALPENIYPASTFPWEFDPMQITVVIILSMVLSLGATLIPSRQGARLDPAEALRYE